MPPVTASKLYDYLKCPHRVWRDIYGPRDEMIEGENAFLQLLWERGVQHEEQVIEKISRGLLGDLGQTVRPEGVLAGETALTETALTEILDLSVGNQDERLKKTIEAMQNKVSLIYQGVIRYEGKDAELMGIPDLLAKLPDESYMPIDIKSGMALEGANEETADNTIEDTIEDPSDSSTYSTSGSAPFEPDKPGKQKIHYGVQLCLYNDILTRLGFATHDKGRIIGGDCRITTYNLTAVSGTNKNNRSFWQRYEEIKQIVEKLMSSETQNDPALNASCKMCVWCDSCKRWCVKTNDLTNLFSLSRKIRDPIKRDLGILTVDDLVDLDVESALTQKKSRQKSGDKNFLKGVAGKTLAKNKRRAFVYAKRKKPVAYKKIEFPKVSFELFFDIEDDPTQEFVYMHGVYERSRGGEVFKHFTARELTPEAEKAAWQNFWEYIATLPEGDFAVYFFSAHEKTTYKKLQERYPDVISAQGVAEFFNNPNVIDLYKTVLADTDWPLSSYSVKELATYLGFKWRDETPSGALSIEWFNKYLESGSSADTRDAALLDRILLYNEDDCKATMVLKDGLEKLEVLSPESINAQS